MIADAGIPVFAIKGQSLVEHWDYQDRIFLFNEGTCNLILDDGGDATLYILLGARAEAGELEVLENPQSEEETAIYAQIKKRMASSPGIGLPPNVTRSKVFPRKPPPAFTVCMNWLKKANCRSLRST